MFANVNPKTLVPWLILAAIVYLVLPYDLLPDFLGLPGRIDDVVVMGWLAWFYRNHLRQYLARAAEGDAAGSSKKGHSEQKNFDESPGSGTFDAYAVLGVTPSASSDTIRAAYRARMQEYHPDKVAHLGDDLQTLAHERTQQIQRAYQQLSG